MEVEAMARGMLGEVAEVDVADKCEQVWSGAGRRGMDGERQL
jgi:hypothetical protein